MREFLRVRIAPLFLLSVFSHLLIALTVEAQHVSAMDAASEKKIERLIADLGNDDFAIREAATRALMELKEEPAALRKALQSPDAEVRRRVEAILEVHKWKSAGAILGKGIALCKDGRAVEMADRMVYCKQWNREAEEEGWIALRRLFVRTIDATEFCYAPSGPGTGLHRFMKHFMAEDFLRHKKAIHPKEFFGNEVPLVNPAIRLVRGENVSWGKMLTEGPAGGIVVASGNVRLGGAQWSFIVAGGEFKAIELFGSIVICDGDVEVDHFTECPLVIARGKFTCRKGHNGNGIIRSENVVFYPYGPKKPDPLAFVKFFELANVGLTAAERDPKGEPIRDGVGLKEVRKESPFASGLRADDIVLAMDGTKLTSTEVFRRLLRRKLAQGGPTLTFTVRRGRETLDVPIRLRD